MTTQTKTQAQTYHEEVETLKTEGMSNAEAVRTVAEKHGKSVGAVRGSLYQYRTNHQNGNGSAPRRGRRATLGVEDHLERARQSLHDALGLIDREVAEAQATVEAAQARYEELTASAETRKGDIEQRLAALS
jgi:uncharacterized protein YoaH (UPF0181 family)